jgi:hypothetical protein
VGNRGDVIDELAAETIAELLCMRAPDKTEDVHPGVIAA